MEQISARKPDALPTAEDGKTASVALVHLKPVDPFLCTKSEVQTRSATGAPLTRLQTLDATARIRPSTYDATARSVQAIVATTMPVQRFDYAEVLEVSSEACDLRRASGGGRVPVRGVASDH
jgi:hypothetical protein